MSDTPRSDNLIKRHGVSTTRNGEKAVLVSDYKFSEDAFTLARQLESELAEARAEIDRKDALIKQMVEALESWITRLDLKLSDSIQMTNAAVEAWRLHNENRQH